MNAITLQRKKVFDGVLRLIHWSVALSVIFLVASAWLAEAFEDGSGEKVVWQMHVFAGYWLALGLVARLFWGVFGPRYARWGDLWHPRTWLRPFQDRAETYGHDRRASAVYLCIYLVLAIMVATGLAMAGVEHGMGPLASLLHDRVAWMEALEDPHEALQVVILGFLVVHIAALVIHEWRTHTPIAQEMISGFQYRAIPPGDPHKAREE